ncbi:hypothetical protein [Marinobacterium lutimaris]|uniref:Uncharacterized protein n=1 Tax=Marinobacterium lutimaris TaxID=568106 RepID=A0A1H5YCW9_9GAMM|nr:hypothetical protein [Marinobacterium lutimaris]SEG21903.1 hypothetical protein SAMN05444390_1011710 [Marinobacterium lutimaris]
MNELIALLVEADKQLHELQILDRNGTDADEDEYSNGYRAGFAEGQQKGIKEAMKLVASRLEKTL